MKVTPIYKCRLCETRYMGKQKNVFDDTNPCVAEFFENFCQIIVHECRPSDKDTGKLLGVSDLIGLQTKKE